MTKTNEVTYTKGPWKLSHELGDGFSVVRQISEGGDLLPEMLNQQTIDKLKEWVKMNNGDTELTATFLRDHLRIGGIKTCRAIVAEALGLK